MSTLCFCVYFWCSVTRSRPIFVISTITNSQVSILKSIDCSFITHCYQVVLRRKTCFCGCCASIPVGQRVCLPNDINWRCRLPIYALHNFSNYMKPQGYLKPNCSYKPKNPKRENFGKYQRFRNRTKSSRKQRNDVFRSCKC